MARIATSHDLELAYKNFRERAPRSLACIFAERNGMDNRYSNFILKSFQDFGTLGFILRNGYFL